MFWRRRPEAESRPDTPSQNPTTTRRGFFNEILRGRKTNGKTINTDIEDPKTRPKTIDRRGFLKKAAATTAVIAGGTFLKSELGHALEGSTEIQQMSAIEFIKKIERKIEGNKMEYIYKMYRENRTLDEQDAMRAWLFGGKKPEILYKELEYVIEDSIKTDRLNRIYNIFEKFDAHGFIYRYIEEHPEIKKHRVVEQFLIHTRPQEFYTVRAVDYLPTSKTIRKKDIDPRLGAQELVLISQLETRDAKDSTKSTKEHPGWASDERQEIFQEYLDNKTVRDILTSDNTITLAEAFSIIKAAHRYKEEHPNKDIKAIIQKLIEERRLFMQREVIGPNIDEIIYVHNITFGDDASSLQYKAEKLSNLGGQDKKHLKTTEISAKNDSPKKQLVEQTIPESKGQTVIFFNGHGDERSVDIMDGVTITVDDIAKSLITRLENSNDGNGNIDYTDLSKMTFLFDSCHSYELTKNLIEAIKQIYKEKQRLGLFTKPFSNINLPTIITATQEGSLSFGKKGLYTAFVNKLPDKQKFNGEYLMRRAQPNIYQYSDMTFFTGKDDDGFIEIGQSEMDKIPKIAA